jgi:hypothetical protein
VPVDVLLEDERSGGGSVNGESTGASSPGYGFDSGTASNSVVVSVSVRIVRVAVMGGSSGGGEMGAE